MRALPTALILAVSLAVSPATEARFVGGETRALIVGVDAYDGRLALRGAVNDARLIAEVLRHWTRETVLLLDHDATVARILDTWRRMIEQSQRSDTIYVHFSGHGIQVPTNDPRELDGKDEAFLTIEYRRDERGQIQGVLLDNTIDELAAEMERKGVRLVFVADTCHAAGLTRNLCGVGQSACRTPTGTLQFDPSALRPIVVQPASNQPELARPNVVFVAAAIESEAVREVTIDGRKHGALSVAMARALSGEADLNRDGRITIGELDRYVAATVRRLAHGQQAAVHAHHHAGDAELVRLPGVRPPVVTRERSTIFVANMTLPADLLPGGIRQVTDPDAAEMHWLQETAELRRANGDVLGYDVHDLATLRRILQWRAHMLKLDALLRLRPLDAVVTRRPDLAFSRDLSPAQLAEARRAELGLILRGQSVAIVTPAIPYRETVVFSISTDGTVHPIHPHPTARTVVPARGERYVQPLCPVPPFGATTAVIVSSDHSLDHLRSMLAAGAGRIDPEAALGAIEAAIHAGAALGLVDVLTSPERAADSDSSGCR